jgi:galactose oxidase-like protein
VRHIRVAAVLMGLLTWLPDAAAIASVVMIRHGSVTHAFNQDQRYIPLAWKASAGSLTIQSRWTRTWHRPATTCCSS